MARDSTRRYILTQQAETHDENKLQLSLEETQAYWLEHLHQFYEKVVTVV